MQKYILSQSNSLEDDDGYQAHVTTCYMTALTNDYMDVQYWCDGSEERLDGKWRKVSGVGKE